MRISAAIQKLSLALFAFLFIPEDGQIYKQFNRVMEKQNKSFLTFIHRNFLYYNH